MIRAKNSRNISGICARIASRCSATQMRPSGMNSPDNRKKISPATRNITVPVASSTVR